MGSALTKLSHRHLNLAAVRTTNKRRIRPWSDLPADSAVVCKRYKNRVTDELPPSLLNNTEVTESRFRQQFDLPPEILGEVLDLLSPADKIRFSAVCKTWWRLVRECKNGVAHVLPWSVSYEMEARTNNEPIVCVCKLFDPMRQRPYSVHEICSEEKFSKCRTTVRGLNHGWLAFSWESRTDVTSFLLFSPFTEEIMSLPELEFILDDNAHILSSHSPSSDCDFHILHGDRTARRFKVRTCKSGDMKWKTSEFGVNHKVYGAVYYEGWLYCVDGHSNVRAYNVIHKNQIVVTTAIIITRSLKNCRFDLIVCEEKLLFVQWDQAYGSEEDDLFHVFEFSKFEGTWVEKQSLGDQALVLSCPSFSVSTLGSTRNMANRIYYRSYNSTSKCNELKYFSLKDGKCHRCEDSMYSRSWLADGMWVQPPQFRR